MYIFMQLIQINQLKFMINNGKQSLDGDQEM